jgi:hypothetical protein
MEGFVANILTQANDSSLHRARQYLKHNDWTTIVNTELTEEEMRRALFGSVEAPAPIHVPAQEVPPQVVIVPPAAPKKPKSARTFTPRLIVTLQVGNEFEGATQPFVYEADTLSKLQAELDAVKAARKKFKYIEVVSIKSA